MLIWIEFMGQMHMIMLIAMSKVMLVVDRMDLKCNNVIVMNGMDGRLLMGVSGS